MVSKVLKKFPNGKLYSQLYYIWSSFSKENDNVYVCSYNLVLIDCTHLDLIKPNPFATCRKIMKRVCIAPGDLILCKGELVVTG